MRFLNEFVNFCYNKGSDNLERYVSWIANSEDCPENWTKIGSFSGKDLHLSERVDTHPGSNYKIYFQIWND